MPEKVDELIRETLVEQSEVLAVPPDVWNRLQAGLPMPVSGPEQRGPGLWRRLRVGAKLEVAAALLLILGLVGLGVLRNMPRHTELAVGPGAPLTIEEYPIVERSVDQPGHFEYNDRLTEEIMAKRAKWRDVTGGHRVVYLNKKLAPTGYKLVEVDANTNTFDLYKGDALVRSGLSEVYDVAVSDDGRDFAIVAGDGKGGVLVRSGGFTPWDVQAHIYTRPVFAGSDLVEFTQLGEGRSRFAILRNGRQVYQGDLDPTRVDLPVKGFFGWNGQWVLELLGDVIIEGKSLKEQHGYDEVFGWQLIDGKPFYFYRTGGKIGISYDGRHQGAEYDEVMHYRCCEPAMFNPAGNDTMAWFHARKGEMWYYVEAGVYD
ncbi:MAG TPA: hypothetical protein VD973_08645 [Symbiobacteriaceae bacterium]|nr:hypothetical protein [Symbiobacteriaceae bacterium]